MASEGAIGWDDEVSSADAGEMTGNDLVVLPDGEYEVTINKIERGNFKGSAKMGPCGMVKVGAIIDGGELGHGYATTRFYMHTKTLFRIYEFMEALGIRKKGDKTSSTVPWSKVTKGMKCRAQVGVHTYQGKDSNEITKWILADDGANAEADDMPEF